MNRIFKSQTFKNRFFFLKKSQFKTKSYHNKYQLKKFIELVKYVEIHIPFYRDYMKKNNFSFHSIKSLRDIKLFPIIDKKFIQKRYKDFLPINERVKNFHIRTTGGSTGTPLTIYYNNNFLARDKANTNYYMSVFDLNIFDYKSIRIYGDKIENNILKKKKYWKKENNKLVMSCYHINKNTIHEYLKEINSFKPIYIHSRPSSIYTLAKLIEMENLNLDCKIKYIFCDGEYVTLGQRKMIERIFKARLINIYGHTEGCVFGHPCKKSNNLHFPPQVGILEVLDSDNNDCNKVNQKGKLVVTGFNNYSFPLIRYNTFDYGITTSQNCSCGRKYKILKEVEGRLQDYVYDKYKNIIPLAPAIFNYNDMNWRGINEFKVVQKKIGVLNFLIKPERKINLNISLIKKKLNSIVGKNFIINVKINRKIKKTKIGKHRYLEQKLKINI